MLLVLPEGHVKFVVLAEMLVPGTVELSLQCFLHVRHAEAADARDRQVVPVRRRRQRREKEVQRVAVQREC